MRALDKVNWWRKMALTGSRKMLTENAKCRNATSKAKGCKDIHLISIKSLKLDGIQKHGKAMKQLIQ